MKHIDIPEVLETKEAAQALKTTENNLHTNHSRFGHFHGLRPIRLGRKLMWPADGIAKLLRGERIEAQ